MGHDISAYKNTQDEKEIAYLRRGAFNTLNGTIYNALNCHKNNCGVSGCGTTQIFTKEEIEKGLEYVKDNPDLEPELDFLNECLKNLDKDNTITIFFG